MRIAILTNRADSFPKPLAEGLSRMLASQGVEPLVLYDGLDSLPRHARVIGQRRSITRRMRSVAGQMRNELRYRHLLRELRSADAAIIVGHMPHAYYEGFFDDARLRGDLPKLPVVLYDLVYLPTRGQWADHLLQGNVSGVPEGHHWGMNRYDYYLCVTEVSEYPLLENCPMFARVGLNLEVPELKPGQSGEFTVLLDFERTDHPQERAIQVEACRRAGVKVHALAGQYPMADIRRIYASCHAYCIAHRESFGLPICELQACGAKVFTPYADWCPAHYLPADSNGATAPRLPANILVYDNDPAVLATELIRWKEAYRAEEAVANFQRQHPHFYVGDRSEIARFVELLRTGQIDSQSHVGYPNLASLVASIGSASARRNSI